MAESLRTVSAAVLERVEPDETEATRVERVAETVTERASAAASNVPVACEITHVGSTARGTWLAGDRDVDIFLQFEPTVDRDTLESYGLEIGHEVLPDGVASFAEHPYVTGVIEGVDVDIVPCYAVKSPTDIKSAVDRTPFHNEYLMDRLTAETRREIRLLKQFLTGIDIYGSNLKTRGFSGFLTEVLILEYGSFETLLKEAGDWQPQVELDPEDHGNETFEDPLVVIDPTDPERNVAAVLSRENVAKFQHHARAFLTDPSLEYLFPAEPEPLTESTLKSHLDRRATTILALECPRPDIVDDQLYPQLRRSLNGMTRQLEGAGFSVIRTGTFVEGTVVFCFELTPERLPTIERHEGPPVSARNHAESFLDTYSEDGSVYGPFIDGERYVVERPRAVCDPTDILESERVFKAALGPAIERALKTDRHCHKDHDLIDLLPEFGKAMARYFDPTP